jgi:hypothetical protein
MIQIVVRYAQPPTILSPFNGILINLCFLLKKGLYVAKVSALETFPKSKFFSTAFRTCVSFADTSYNFSLVIMFYF